VNISDDMVQMLNIYKWCGKYANYAKW